MRKMFELWKVPAFLVMVSLMSSVSARRNLTEFCSDLSRSMASNPEVYTNPQVAMKEALGQLNAWSNLGTWSRSKLAKAWKVVVNDEGCNARSAHHASVIAQCRPEIYPEMSTLAQAVRRYTTKCLTPIFWDKRVKQALAGLFGNPDKSYLTYFIDDKFIEQYRKDNPEELELHFADVKGQDCCRPWRSHNSLYAALDSIIGAKKPGRTNEILRNEPEYLEEVLEFNLFDPCDSYLYALHGTILRAKYVSKYYRNGVTPISPDFRDVIFRYKYCLPFLFLNSPSSKLNKIGINGFFRH